MSDRYLVLGFLFLGSRSYLFVAHVVTLLQCTGWPVVYTFHGFSVYSGIQRSVVVPCLPDFSTCSDDSNPLNDSERP